jgi:hypothetical protein
MFNYKWNLQNGYPAPGINYHGLKVFGTFICGGGSTMGYKLSGYKYQKSISTTITQNTFSKKT